MGGMPKRCTILTLTSLTDSDGLPAWMAMENPLYSGSAIDSQKVHIMGFKVYVPKTIQ